MWQKQAKKTTATANRLSRISLDRRHILMMPTILFILKRRGSFSFIRTNKRRQYPWEKEEEYGLAVQEDFDAAVNTYGRDQKMAELIQSERNRRLGVSVNTDAFEHDDDDENNHGEMIEWMCGRNNI